MLKQRAKQRQETLLLAAAIVIAHFAFTHPAAAQTPTPQPPPTKPLVFDVISVKPNKSTQIYGGGVHFTPDGVVGRSVSLKSLLRFAYNQYIEQFWPVSPAWLESANYDIEAKFDPEAFPNITEDQRRAMLQALLADRFKLAIHTETRELPEFALTVTKGGPKLRDADPDKLMRDNSNHLYCRAGLTNFRQCTMTEFANIARIVGIDQVVVDKTGLTGRYDFELRFARPGETVPQGVEAPPDVFEALQDQLGLKLEPIRAPGTVFVIDHIERPSEN